MIVRALPAPRAASIDGVQRNRILSGVGGPPDNGCGVMSLISLANFRKAAVAMVAVAAAFPVAAAAREFRVADTQSEDYPTVQALNFLARTIGERSGGRHTIRVFHSRQLGEEKETIEQTRAGALDLNRPKVAPVG